MVEEVNIWIEVAKQVPALAVLAGVVIYFLRYLEHVTDKYSQREAERDKEHADRIARVADDYRDAMNRNTAAFVDMSRSIGQKKE